MDQTATTPLAERGVPLLRVAAPERLYDREAVLGRDTSSVFPSLRRGAALGALPGAKQFVTESELAELQAAGGGGGDAEGSGKPLWAVLAANKEAKEEEFQAKWKLMKQGVNKPLEADEAAWLGAVDGAAAAERARLRREEAAEMEAFALAREAALMRPAAEPVLPGAGAGAGTAAAGPQQPRAGAVAVKRPAAAPPRGAAPLVVRPRVGAAGPAGGGAAAAAGGGGGGSRAGPRQEHGEGAAVAQPAAVAAGPQQAPLSLGLDYASDDG